MANNFEQLEIFSNFIIQLKKRKIEEPTDIQRKVIPCLNDNKNVFFTSATGTGKTFAYLLPLLGKMIQETQKGLRFLIIAPTLELCTQIKGEIDFLSDGTELKSALLIGSVNIERQIENLKKTKPDIVIGNPNRLLVLAKKKLLKIDNLQFIVLDEADRLVSDEMIDDTRELCKITARSAQKKDKNILIAACSATMNEKNREKLLETITVKQADFIESQDNEILREKIEHWAIFSEKRRKEQTLRSLLSALKGKKKHIKTLVFTSRGDEASLILSRLQYHHIAAAGLFGKAGKKPLSGSDRKTALDSFRNGSIETLVSTDLAARGLDIQGITHVIALDVPDNGEVYIHRSGRTARAGKRGIMITIGDETQMRLLAALEKKLKIRIQPKELHYGKICVPETE
ncbi:MAG: DEAD/DEAH box helicase [Treponema sp.]|nr:DEAD/DEAH box helicase [Treponema sp.]